MTSSNNNSNDCDDEDCPLCCNPMKCSDIRYPLLCPTITCNYNYCYDCIMKFIQAASEGYQIASDGSNQVKIIVKCPICRCKYQINNANNHKTEDIHVNAIVAATAKTTTCNYTSDSIVQSILLLRQASDMERLLLMKKTKNDAHEDDDSNLSASDLRHRNEFVDTTSMNELEDSFLCVQTYHNALLSYRYYSDNDDCTNTTSSDNTISNSLRIQPLNWELFRSILSQKPNYNNEKNGRTIASSGTTAGYKDPTLFGGLEELMTSAEHEFVTGMMISGNVDAVAQAASILYSIMEMASSKRQQPQPTTSGTNNNKHEQQQLRPVRLSVKELENITRLRRRFPLPVNMPRCVSIPLHDPTEVTGTRSQILFFSRPKTTQENDSQESSSKQPSSSEFTLTLKNVSGIAGRIGLRKGDIVTHVDGTNVDTYEEYVYTIQQSQQQHNLSSSVASSEQKTPTIQIIVNATPDVAKMLQERYNDMKQNNIQFNYS